MTIFRDTADPGNYNDRSSGDRRRHNEKVREAIKENLRNIISEEAIIGQSGNKKIKVPIKGVKEFRFVYGENSPGVGQGTGDEKQGDVIEVGHGEDENSGEPGSAPGEDIYETEIDLSTIIEMMFEDLELPYMQRKKMQYIEAERDLKRKGHQIHGIPPRLDKKQTQTKRLMRKQAAKRAERERKNSEAEEENRNVDSPFETARKRFPFHNIDLRYDRVKPDIRRYSNAVIFCVMDTSGSMDLTKKYLARAFYFLLYNFIKTKYQNTEIVFIAHHTEAQEVTEHNFFHKGESGGTKISSGYRKTLEIIRDRYDHSIWNVYVFHCSDGDNFEEDNNDAVKYAEQLAEISNLFGYAEIKPQGSYSWSSMIELFGKSIKSESFSVVKIHETKEVWFAISSLLGKEKIKA